MHEVPVEDLQEQYLPPVPDVRFGHEHPDDRPLADLLEQEFPVNGPEDVATGRDDDRVEPIEVEEWFGRV